MKSKMFLPGEGNKGLIITDTSKLTKSQLTRLIDFFSSEFDKVLKSERQEFTSAEVFIARLISIAAEQADKDNVPVLDYFKSHNITPEMYYSAILELQEKGLHI